ncbi:eggshell protein 2A-like [Panicum miliaceum]|uniref:Eggshell protein 2A-like n=1 Tax=Panicum miliaceum TaxID=4540 RepID=A0A3L6QX37_PANMI|nr:eggshell protein 2A-like [Panicum miliaceum]
MSPTKTGVAVLLALLALSAPLASWAAGQGRPNPGGGIPWFGGGPGPGAGFFGGWGEGGLGYRRGAVVPPSMVCAEQGPCRGKRLTCPVRCFRSFSYKGKNGGGGGGGGGCSFDCTSRCVATC